MEVAGMATCFCAVACSFGLAMEKSVLLVSHCKRTARSSLGCSCTIKRKQYAPCDTTTLAKYFDQDIGGSIPRCTC
eukprot:scaffold5470_cov199-Alexandrium_tamarense.AAC.3